MMDTSHKTLISVSIVEVHPTGHLQAEVSACAARI